MIKSVNSLKENENKKKEIEQSKGLVHTGVLIQELVETPKYRVGRRTKRVMTKEIEKNR